MPAAEVAFERALGYFAPAQAERRFVKAANGRSAGATMALRDLAATFKSLSRADRRLARQILARPTDLGQWQLLRPNGELPQGMHGDALLRPLGDEHGRRPVAHRHNAGERLTRLGRQHDLSS